MSTVLVTSRSFGSGHADPEGLLRDAGLTVRWGDAGHDLEALRPLLAGATGWIVGVAPVCDDHLAAAPALQLLARYGVGADAVDLDAAARRGVVVTNTPGANAEAVADHTIALILAALRDLVVADQAARRGDWSARIGRELSACTIGIVGYGTVGRAVRRRLSGFGGEVLACDPYVPDADVPLLDLSDIAARADVLTLHTPPTRHPLVDRDLLERLPPNAVLVNTARGELLDEGAVAQALRTGRLGAVAVDVLTGGHAAGGPLLEAPNVTVTPHIAGQTVEAVDRMGMAAAEECLRVLVRGEPPAHPVRPTTTEGVN